MHTQRPEVVKALHAEAHSEAWVECRGAIHSAFNRRENNSSITILPSVIERIPVLIFAGDQDLICNHVGLEAMIQAMTWNGAKGLGVSAIPSFLSHIHQLESHTTGCANTILECCRYSSRNMGVFEEPHLR